MNGVRDIARLLQQLRVALDTTPVVIDGYARREIKEIRADRGHLIIELESKKRQHA